jgi:hypothetical protein
MLLIDPDIITVTQDENFSTFQPIGVQNPCLSQAAMYRTTA